MAETVELATGKLTNSIVPEAPLESITVTASPEPENKFSSSTNSSPTSTPIAAASKRIFPSPVSSSSKNPAPASELFASVPFKVRVLPNSSLATKEPAFEPLASVPSKIINPVFCSRKLSINR